MRTFYFRAREDESLQLLVLDGTDVSSVRPFQKLQNNKSSFDVSGGISAIYSSVASEGPLSSTITGRFYDFLGLEPRVCGALEVRREIGSSDFIAGVFLRRADVFIGLVCNK